MDAINIIITASGLIGLVITILSLFFDVKPFKRAICKKDMVLIIIWLSLAILGIVNLYYMRKENDDAIENQSEIDIHESSSSIEEGDSESESSTETLSEDELLIEQNFDLIQQLKAEYSDEDTKILESDTVFLSFSERAGYVFRDLKENAMSCNLSGIKVTPSKVIILDYFNDEIIYSFTPKQEGDIEYLPGDQNKFYCVVFHDEYEIYVTPPVSVVGGEKKYGFHSWLNTKDEEYTPLFQIRTYIRDSKLDNSYSIISNDYIIKVQYNSKDSGNKSYAHEMEISEYGILSYSGFTYFSLNTNYEMYISLYRKTDDDPELIEQQIFDGTISNSNLINLYFDLEDENTSE